MSKPLRRECIYFAVVGRLATFVSLCRSSNAALYLLEYAHLRKFIYIDIRSHTHLHFFLLQVLTTATPATMFGMIFQVSLLIINAIAILNEDRFLAKSTISSFK
jgi:hypothetical protein